MMVAGLVLCVGGGCGYDYDIPRTFFTLGGIARVGILAGLLTATALAVWVRLVRPHAGGLSCG